MLLSAFILMLSTFRLIRARGHSSLKKAEKDFGATVSQKAGPSSVVNELQVTYKLSTREAEVLQLLSEGHTKKKIAELLFVSVNSVQTYSKTLYSKLGVHNRQEIVDLVNIHESDPEK